MCIQKGANNFSVTGGPVAVGPRIQDTAKGPPVGMGGCRLRWHGKPGLIVISITPDRTGLSTRRWQGIRSGLRAAGSGVGLHVGCCVVISAVSGVEGFPGVARLNLAGQPGVVVRITAISRQSYHTRALIRMKLFHPFGKSIYQLQVRFSNQKLLPDRAVVRFFHR